MLLPKVHGQTVKKLFMMKELWPLIGAVGAGLAFGAAHLLHMTGHPEFQ